MLSRMGFARQMWGAEDTVALPLEDMNTFREIHTGSALLHVEAALGRIAQKAVVLSPPCFVRTCTTGCADDAVLLVSPWCMRTLPIPTLHAGPLPLPMLAHPRRPRTTFQTIPLRSV